MAEGKSIIISRIEDALIKKSKYIDLSGLGLTEIPQELVEIHSL